MKLIKLFFLFVFIFPYYLYSSTQALLKLRIFPQDYKVFINNNEAKIIKYDSEDNIKYIKLNNGYHKIKIVSDNYVEKEFSLEINKDIFIEDKLEKKNSTLKLINIIRTGKQPKSVRFTPDGKFILIPLLDDNGIDIVDAQKMSVIKRIIPLNLSSKKGFVETAVLKKKNEFWVSQMTTGYIHVVDLSNFEMKKSIKTPGKYPKVIVFDRNETKGFISNWLSKDITILDTENYTVLKTIKAGGIPRGMVLSPDERYIYVAIFDKKQINKIDIDSGKIVYSIKCDNSMRHLVPDYKNRVFYASSMGSGKVFKISFDNDKVLKENYIAPKLNTIVLSEDGNFLYVSSRGRNGKKGYLLKGPEFGKVFVLKSSTLEVVDWVWGKNQPTGLDVYNNMVVFSDFLDGEIEVYKNF
ncbi:MAG TPA: YncE family protein [Spirochaetota bacterium]|nr:YncE family protein [Spirochaetota bacterium]HOM37994.1 YncE family protein [Spirochaetota bacterium]HPQ48798.1 YncE family protein [Spirochaetota bacterium]